MNNTIYGDANFVDPSPSVRTTMMIKPFDSAVKKWCPLDAFDYPAGLGGIKALSHSHALLLQRLDENRTYATRAVVSPGELPSKIWRVGNQWMLKHIGTKAYLGYYEVVGIVSYGAGGAVIGRFGEVESRKIRTAVLIAVAGSGDEGV